MFVEWSNDLETGVPFVDADHKVLINLLNQVDDCINQNEETSILGSVLDALVEYTNYHFLREETMMELSRYGGLDEHRELHSLLSRQVRKIYDEYQVTPWKVNILDLRDFLKKWLVEHIMKDDFDFRDTCRDNLEAVQQAGNLGFLNDGSSFDSWEHIRIMLVDDNPNFRRLVRTILRAVGIRHIQSVENPQEGLSRLAERPADVVLCDWVMDDMNGTEFAHTVHEMKLPTQVVLLTGYSTDKLKERSSELWIRDYIEKPVKARDLLETISRVVTSIAPANESTVQAPGLIEPRV
ncbi:MAG: bacteriohemerythrin [Magnetovibrio sp.]|nr:bacteriohemerythrin [Magnetovibrio sp.]